VAAVDATHRGYGNLATYHGERGEVPGIWLRPDLSSLTDFPVAKFVSEAQLRALFGQGRHPNAEAIRQAAKAAGKNPSEIDAASRLGNPYRMNMFHRRAAGAFRDYNVERRLRAGTRVPAEVRAVNALLVARLRVQMRLAAAPLTAVQTRCASQPPAAVAVVRVLAAGAPRPA